MRQWASFCSQGSHFYILGIEVAAGVDKIYDEDDLVGGESIEDYYTRSEKVIRTILDRHNGGRIFFFNVKDAFRDDSVLLS